MKKIELLERIDYAISKGNIALSSRKNTRLGADYVENGHYAGFRSSALSVISSIFGEKHPYYKEFDQQASGTYVHNIEAGINILQSLRFEIENGWLVKIKQLVSAEIFSDFLDMCKYFLDSNYKDPAAVMIGSVLEEHLRQLCINNSIETTFTKGTDLISKKAELLNSELSKADIYGILEQKNVTAWLDLRNKAAHGKYHEYTIEQVKLMYLGVLDFITKTR